LFLGGHFAPATTGHFGSATGGHFAPAKGGQFTLKVGGHFHRFFQIENEVYTIENLRFILPIFENILDNEAINKIKEDIARLEKYEVSKKNKIE
jgi:uncharacterized Fe-S cluster-containing protein